MRTLAVFFVLCYAITWPCFIAVARFFPADTPTGYALVLLGAWAPSIVALAVTRYTLGRAGVAALLSQLTRVNVSWRWYAFAALFMVTVKLAAALINRAFLGTWPEFGPGIWLMPFAIVISTPFQAGEEIGWRGFALPRMTERMGLAGASLLLGVIWALWHVPQFYIHEGDAYAQSFPTWSLQAVALSVTFAWVYAKTKGSLPIVMLLHAAVNNSKDIVPSAPARPGPGVFSFEATSVQLLTVLLLWLPAAFFLVKMRGEPLVRSPRR